MFQSGERHRFGTCDGRKRSDCLSNLAFLSEDGSVETLSLVCFIHRVSVTEPDLCNAGWVQADMSAGFVRTLSAVALDTMAPVQLEVQNVSLLRTRRRIPNSCPASGSSGAGQEVGREAPLLECALADCCGVSAALGPGLGWNGRSRESRSAKACIQPHRCFWVSSGVWVDRPLSLWESSHRATWNSRHLTPGI